MIVKDGKEYYPINRTIIKKDEKIYYDRELRTGKNYFYLELRSNYNNAEPQIMNIQ